MSVSLRRLSRASRMVNAVLKTWGEAIVLAASLSLSAEILALKTPTLSNCLLQLHIRQCERTIGEAGSC